MTFSDWITVTSIMAAVLFGFFRYYEWQVIYRKHPWIYASIPLIFLFLSGISSFFFSNPHPAWLNGFWGFGIFPGYWPVVWLLLFLVSIWGAWRLFTNQATNEGLINFYFDLMRDEKVFKGLFFKYERRFALGTKHWGDYHFLIRQPRFWHFFPRVLERRLLSFHNDIYKSHEVILKPLLEVQLKGLPNSSLAQEIKVNLSEDTPLLNLYLAEAHFIERNNKLNIFLPTIKAFAESYFLSLKF